MCVMYDSGWFLLLFDAWFEPSYCFSNHLEIVEILASFLCMCNAAHFWLVTGFSDETFNFWMDIYIDQTRRKSRYKNMVQWMEKIQALKWNKKYLSRDMPTKVTVRPAKTQICPVLSDSSLCAQWVVKDPSLLICTSKKEQQYSLKTSGKNKASIWISV